MANAADEVVPREKQTSDINLVYEDCSEGSTSNANCNNGGSGLGNGPSGGNNDGACCGNNKLRVNNACWSCWEVGFLPGLAVAASGNFFGGIAVGVGLWLACKRAC
ncbi:MAG: hypothetical protein F4Y00_01765 [Bacteroidetes bacterium SB0662_bin_6]|nr:hypothetical protein [Bacteroidetes bacterium SB0668_bin_1]MYE03691.1 hypothetical protein [Bacteroidetes bacterium SB0662_bin_6]